MNLYNNQNNRWPTMIQNYTNTINWVQGVESAKAWQLTPNSNVLLMDSENDGIFYIKTSDNVGMCNLRTFKYEEITENTTRPADLSEYVKKSELETLINQMLGGKVGEQSLSADEHKKSFI